MAFSTDLNFFPPTPGMIDPNNQAPAAWFQNNPNANNAMGGTINGGIQPTAPMTAPNSALSGLGMNLGTAQLGLGAIGTIGSLWSAWQAQQLAREQFQFQKGITNENLANSIQSYNTSLADKIAGRATFNGLTQKDQRDYIDKNKLEDNRKGY